MAENVFASAKILKDDQSSQKYELSNFGKRIEKSGEKHHHFIEQNLETDEDLQTKNSEDFIEESKVEPLDIINNSQIIDKIEPMYKEFDTLAQKIDQISQKLINIEQDGIAKNKELDSQVVNAIRDLKQFASFFEQASFQLENKLLKTSISIAQKIINIEVSQNSVAIAKQTISQLLEKLKNATTVRIHLNPKDYHVLKSELQLEPYIELFEDANVVAGGVVIASNLGNYDGSVEAKISSMLESLDLVI